MAEETLRLRSDKLEWLETDDEVIAIDMMRDVYLSANPSAALLWQELQTGTTESRMVDLLISAYGIDKEQAALDVSAFVTSLRDHDLLEAE